jgi:hypothetical protein
MPVASMKMMLTAEAENVLGGGISEKDIEEAVSYRFSQDDRGEVTLTKGGCEPGDVEFGYRGHVVLRVPAAIADRLGEVLVDVESASDGKSRLALLSLE